MAQANTSYSQWLNENGATVNAAIANHTPQQQPQLAPVAQDSGASSQLASTAQQASDAAAQQTRANEQQARQDSAQRTTNGITSLANALGNGGSSVQIGHKPQSMYSTGYAVGSDAPSAAKLPGQRGYKATAVKIVGAILSWGATAAMEDAAKQGAAKNDTQAGQTNASLQNAGQSNNTTASAQTVANTGNDWIKKNAASMNSNGAGGSNGV